MIGRHARQAASLRGWLRASAGSRYAPSQLDTLGCPLSLDRRTGLGHIQLGADGEGLNTFGRPDYGRGEFGRFLLKSTPARGTDTDKTSFVIFVNRLRRGVFIVGGLGPPIPMLSAKLARALRTCRRSFVIFVNRFRGARFHLGGTCQTSS